MRKLILAVAAVLLTSLAAAAQGTPNAAPPSGSTPSIQRGQSMDDASTSDPNDPQKTWDKAFMKKVFESDQTAIAVGEMAQQNSQSDSIKQFSTSMVEERKKFDSALDPVASKLGVERPKKEKKEVTKLKSLTGPAFDKEFLNIITKQTQQDLKDSNGETTKTPNAGLKEIAAANSKAATQRLEQLQVISQGK